MELKTWNGRIGNHYFQVSQVLVFALLCGVSVVTFPDPILNPKMYQNQVGALLMPKQIVLRGEELGAQDLFVPSSCPIDWKVANFYHTVCTGIPAFRHYQVMQQYLRPYLSEQLLDLESRWSVPEAQTPMLTVHLRGDDVERFPHYAISQPPCSLYRKVLEEHQYKSAMLVYAGTLQKPACLKTFTTDLKHLVELYVPYNKTVTQHLATLMRAKYLFLSFSSFSVSAALLSKEVKVLYRRTGVPWDNVLHSVLNCNVWPGVMMYEYEVYNAPLDSLKEGGPKRWLQEFSGNISGPYLCEYGRDKGLLVNGTFKPTAITTLTSPQESIATTTSTTGISSFEVNFTDGASNTSANLHDEKTDETSPKNSTMPSLFRMYCDQQIPRRNWTKKAKLCPEEVTMSEWNGRIGNHFFQISQIMVFALLCGTPVVNFPKLIMNPKLYQSQVGLLALPRRVVLNGFPPLDGRCYTPEVCPLHFGNLNWYHMHCTRIPVWRHRQVMERFLRPNLGDKLLSAEAAVPREDFEAKETLTVHLRGEDVHVKPNYEVNQPPCRMYEKIISDFSYKSVTIVQVGLTACDGFFDHLSRTMKVYRPRGGVTKHFAILMRARNLVLSFSSFAMSAAILSKEVQVLYRRRDAMWDSVMHAIVNCAVWPGVVMYEYNTTWAHHQRLPTWATSVDDWLQRVPVEDITGPFKCEYGSEMQPYF